MDPRHLTLLVVAVVLCAGVVHAIWNAIASRIPDATVAFSLLGLAGIPFAAVALPLAGLPRSAAIPFVLGSAAIHIAYQTALLQSYRLGGFGRAYPLARGIAPILVGVGGWFIAGEHLSALQIVGTCTIAAALTGIVFAGGRLTRADLPATAVALLTGVTIAAYTVVDGLGARHAHDPVGYLALLFAFEQPVIVPVAVRALRRLPRRELRHQAPAGALAGLLSILAYGIVIWAQTRAPLALVSALRETSVISAAIIAAVRFREPLARRRLLPSVAVAFGIILIAV